MRPGFIITLNSDKKIDFQLFGIDQSLIKVVNIPNQYTVILMGKIYYQDKKENISDADIILNLFKTGNIEELKNIEGELIYTIIDYQQKRILAYRDPLGTYPIYWSYYQQEIILTTHLKKLANLQNCVINKDFLASFLTFPFASVELAKKETVFNNIYRILPGELLECTLEKSVKKIWSWDWNKTINTIPNISPEAAGLQFKNILEKAIQERITNTNFAAHLSGGMDSSSIVCLASKLIKNQPLITLSLVYKLPSLIKETDYIHLIFEKNQNIIPSFVDGDQVLDFNWFQYTIPDHDEPYSGLFHFALEKAMINVISDLKIETILTGNGAEMLVEGNHYYLADLMSQRNWVKLWENGRQWAIAKRQSVGSVLWEYAIAPLTPPWLRQGIPLLLRQGYAIWPHLQEYSIPPWINKDFAQEYQLWPKLLEYIGQLSQYPVEEAFNRLGRQAAVGNWANWYLASPQGIQLSHPFLDNRLISYSFSLPREMREVPGVAKPLLQQAMKGLLPDAIRTRRIKANFNEVYGKGLRQNLNSLIEMVKQSKIDDLAIFDKSILIDCLQQQAMGVGSVYSGRQISTSLSLIVWYDQLDNTTIDN
ncbi:asparagine synthetase B family protein [Crocosphaera sp.]|uniref:asparagine synthase-related protein n=1 Tax=Crocosphaera sp. TaxID=2729996 RepID=UPI00262A72BE|nr:asparagine synthetase B family protein [Crocosphaera sp.]MDJ0582889.1 asparagine synthase-related protein [Crocosphaera sp.]